MLTLRKNAIVTLALPSDSTEERLPLTREREYGVFLYVDGRAYPAQTFRSPRNDEEWREYIRRLRDCNVERSEKGYRGAVLIRSFGRELYQGLAALSPKLLDFLSQTGVPRRLVIQTTRPELHSLPWGALIDTDGKLLAAGDLSITQCWQDFSEDPIPTGDRLNLVSELKPDTQRSTAESLQNLPDVITRDPQGAADILHIEAHGNAVNNEIGEIGPRRMAEKFGAAKIALLWSCYSASGNSWGESPALCLHQRNSILVLSFQAELHNDDAKSIANFLYRDVFGPAASRDPESALVRIRCTKFEKEFEFANWASMTVYLRSPLNLGALPLNGPRVPAAAWNKETADDEWTPVGNILSRTQQGSTTALEMPASARAKLPESVFAGWNGTVIRLDGPVSPASDAIIEELNLSKKIAPSGHPADRLMWLFETIFQYSAPLIVWTNASRCHLDFLHSVSPRSTLTFLLLYKQESDPNISELVDANSLEKARLASVNLSDESGDESWSAAYFAFARSENKAEALRCMRKLKSPSERLLLAGNFVSRFRFNPETGQDVSDLERWQCEEDYYRRAMSQAAQDKNLRDAGRAKLEFGYLLKARGEAVAAENHYRAATEDIERTPTTERDTRWHSALGRVLRDRADLLADSPQRLEEASTLLRRALAIHAFHGRVLQMAYARTTSSRIAFTAARYEEAIENAVDAANTFEKCNVWRGWGEPVEILLDSLAKSSEFAQVKAVADFVIEKVGKRSESQLPSRSKDSLTVRFTLKKAQALWAAGDISGARAALQSLPDTLDVRSRIEADRLSSFLAI